MTNFLTTIQELEELEKKATKGEWSDHSEDGMLAVDMWFEADGKRFQLSYQDMALVALSRNNLPQLLAMARWACENGFPGEKV